MSVLKIEGGNRLTGELFVHGAKNSTLPVLAASLICRSACIIHNCPALTDVDASIRILRHLGCVVQREGTTIIVHADNPVFREIPDHLMREMRSSIVFLGAIAARFSRARLSYPGGCELGPRPIDLHLSALSELGLKIDEGHGFLDCSAEGRLKGKEIRLALPSVGATENIMLAACTAEGVTTIHNAAREPEISDLADFLNGCGAKISGAGESTIYIEGVDSLSGTEHTVIPDRIAASTYMAAAAVTRGKILLRDIIPAHLGPVIPSFLEAGCEIGINGRELTLIAPARLKRIRSIQTMAFPGFPTDSQPPLMAMTTIADGTSMFVENIFENRFKHAGELLRLGAKIKIEGRVAVVEGVPHLTGAKVESTDLRGGAALAVAALAAEGQTQISGLHHIDRGYERFDDILKSLGAKVVRE